MAERELGADARVGAEPLGFHLMRAREYERAIVALRAALARNGRDGRARSLLADALFSCGQREAARREYLRAFLDDPSEVVVDQIADRDVAGLVDSARYSYELGEPILAWVAAVGVVERVFSLPQPELFDRAQSEEQERGPRSFLDLMLRERSARTLEARVPVRRRMKALAPVLFAAYLRAFA